MTCKRGREFLCKLALPSIAAIAGMLCTTRSARAQAIHEKLTAAIIEFADGNMYSCEIQDVSTPTEGENWPIGRSNWECEATLTSGTAVMHAVRTQGIAYVTVNLPFPVELNFLVDVEQRPDGTAHIAAHD